MIPQGLLEIYGRQANNFFNYEPLDHFFVLSRKNPFIFMHPQTGQESIGEIYFNQISEKYSFVGDMNSSAKSLLINTLIICHETFKIDLYCKLVFRDKDIQKDIAEILFDKKFKVRYLDKKMTDEYLQKFFDEIVSIANDKKANRMIMN